MQYVQRLCCICNTKKADSIAAQPSLMLPHHSATIRLPPSIICDSCHSDMTWLPPPSVVPLTLSNLVKLKAPSISTLAVQSAVIYDGYMRAALIAFKYKEAVDSLPVLVHALRQLPRPRGCHAKNSVIVVVPTTANRLRSRGFDPTYILAYYLSKHWGIPLWAGVTRIDDTVRQQGLSRHQRHLNINNAFKILDTPSVKRVILFDDVITTGSTLIALTKSLIEAHPNLLISAYTLVCQK